jgi:nucleosome binding factor SPN SPT16 subunit
MVTILPCSEALISLVDKPPFVAQTADLEHVHFERVNFAHKDFDMVLVYKAGTQEKGEDEFSIIKSIPRSHIDTIKAWLDGIADVTFTEGIPNMDWKKMMPSIIRDPAFWDSEDEDGDRKPVGWDLLRGGAGAADSEEEDEEESEYSDEDASDDGDDDGGW